MHNIDIDFDINLEEISKIEGAASLSIKVRNKKIEDLKFSITEWKRFYTQAIKGKSVFAVPQLVDRICGTCSNAHLLCSIKAIENAYNIKVSKQTLLLRKLLYYGLIIRDHALHLYVFALPDIFNKNSILDFDENDPIQHKLLEDTFEVKEVGNRLSIITGGRSVHAPLPTVGGFLKYPSLSDLKNLKSSLLEIRPKILELIKIFSNSFTLELERDVIYSSLESSDFSFITGIIKTSDGKIIEDINLGEHIKGVIVPYSHARGFSFDGKLFMVGAMSRINNGKESLNNKTKESVSEYLKKYPSRNIYDNDLGQAIEILHAIDASVEIIDNLEFIEAEPVIKPDLGQLKSEIQNPKYEIPQEYLPLRGGANPNDQNPNIQKLDFGQDRLAPESTLGAAKRARMMDGNGARIGIGVIEAPRGTLYHRYEINEKGIIEKAEIIVPTGQNQVVIEKAIYEKVKIMVAMDASKEEIINETEKIIRAFDPCMSCASHFLKVRWT